MIELLTAGTPNGHKVSIALEEMQLDYRYQAIDLGNREQKQDWFLALNPNGRIPVIIDHQPDFQTEPFVVFESGAILLYLAEKTGLLLPSDAAGKSRAMQWLMFQMGGLGPMMGQANVFLHYAEEKIPYAITRYQKETRRLLEVLDRGLRQQDYLAGTYSIADIANFSWARGYVWSGAEIDGLDNLAAWLERIAERPAVRAGLDIPASAAGDDADKEQDSEAREKIIHQARSFLV